MNIHDENKAILLSNGNAILVQPRDYPWLQEWDWHFDTETHQAVRFSEGEKIFLYHELLRQHRSEEVIVALQKESLVRIFNADGRYSKLEKMWERRVDYAKALNINFPSLDELVCRGLSVMILLYYLWLDGEFTYRLVDGALEEVPMPEARYLTFKEWLLTEYTGNFIEDGIPESYDIALLDSLGEGLLDLLEASNDEVDLEAVWEQFEARKLSLTLPLLRIRTLLENYLIPVV